MTTDPNPTELPLDETLLDEALRCDATPAELEAKIIALTDPQMLSLMDEALAPQAADDQLTQRILAATSDQLTGAPSHAGQPSTGVLARIGPSTARYAAAAAIALAVGLGVWFVNQGPADDTDTTIADAINTPDTIGDNAQDANGPDWLNNALAASSEGLFASEASPFEDALDDASDSLDDMTISRDTLWAELDAYEAFLDDIES